MDGIIIENMVLSGIHGATKKEHENAQPFRVDLEVGYHQPLAGMTDDLTKTLDYRAIKKIIHEVIAGLRQNLVESLAEKIAQRVLAETNAYEVVVSIIKLDIWQGIGRPGVKILRRRIPAQLGLKDFDLEGVLAELVNHGATSVPMLPEARREKLLAEALAKSYVEREKQIKASGVQQELSGCDDFMADDVFSCLRDDFTELLRLKFTQSNYRLTEVFCHPFNFNDMALQKYPPGSLGITPHRDGKSSVNLIVIFLLGGEGRFAICDNRDGLNPQYLDTTPGNVIMMRGPGFMGSTHQPFHFVSHVNTEQVTFGMRQNKKISQPSKEDNP